MGFTTCVKNYGALLFLTQPYKLNNKFKSHIMKR